MLGKDLLIIGVSLVMILFSGFLGNYFIFFPDEINEREVVVLIIMAACICLVILQLLFDWDITQNIQDMLELYLGE